MSAYQWEQTHKDAAVDGALRLAIVAGDDVAYDAQRGRLYFHSLVPRELDDARTDARVEHGLDLVVRAVAEVRERPASICEHLVVRGRDELHEHGQRGRHNVPGRLRLAAAQIRERPGAVAQHRDLGLGFQLLEQRREHLVREDEVASLGRVARDVAKRPHRLLAHVIVRRHEELHEIGHRAASDHHARVLRRARGKVRERPSRLELEHWVVSELQKLHKARHQARRDHLRDWRRALDAEQPADLRERGQLVRGVVRVDPHYKLVKGGLDPGLRALVGYRVVGRALHYTLLFELLRELVVDGCLLKDVEERKTGLTMNGVCRRVRRQ